MTKNEDTRCLSAFLPALFAVLAFAILVAAPQTVADSARGGLYVCAGAIIPSLFPFFVLSSLMLELGVPYRIAAFAQPLSARLFHTSGEGTSAFILGLAGGYPLGAVSIAEMYRSGTIKKSEAERLLSFCNNSGPAFIVSAAGVGIFGGSAAGLTLFAVHILASVLTGMIFSIGAPKPPVSKSCAAISAAPLAPALSKAVKSSVINILSVCGFVVFFSAVTGILKSSGILFSAALMLSKAAGVDISCAAGFLHGLIELGGGISSMYGSSASCASFTMCSFLLGFGGLCVHLQTVAAVSGTGLSCSKHTAGKLLQASISTALSFLAWHIFF